MRRLAALFLLLPGLAKADLLYTVTPEPNSQSIRVVLNLAANSDSAEFRIPAWAPGYYVLQKYQNNISDVKVTDESGKEQKIERGDDRAWRVATHPGAKLVLSYRVLGNDPGLGFFAISVKPHTVYINGAAGFMYPKDRLTEPIRVRFNLPPDWDVATPMEKKGAEWIAEGYDELIDHPIQLGKFERRAFTVEGIPFEAVFVTDNGSAPRCNPDVEAKELSQLSVPAIKMMGGAPFRKYFYILHLAVGNFGGGLEHRASNVIATSNSSQLRLNELATHEFFHAWDVKQIRPKALGPFDYTQKVRVKGLWFSEGVDDYYAHIHSYRAGFRDANTMIGMFGGQIAELQAGKTRLTKTAEDASMEAWEGGSFGTGDLSYYTKGSVAGLIFDVAIRDATNGQKSLDDVMRLMFVKYRLPNPGFDDDGILNAINEVAGTDMTELYRKVVQSTEEVPYELLAKIGLRLRVPGQQAAGLGYQLYKSTVQSVDTGLVASGLQKGDRILKVDDKAFGPGCYAHVTKSPTYKLQVSREGKNLVLNMRVVPERTGQMTLELDPFADERAERLREGWLKR